MFGSWGVSSPPAKDPFSNAKDLLQQAINARTQGDYDLSLQFYQSSLTILLNLVKSCDQNDPNKRLYLQMAQTNMNDAEEVKRLNEEKKHQILQNETVAAALNTPTIPQEPIPKSVFSGSTPTTTSARSASSSKAPSSSQVSPRATAKASSNPPTSATKKRALPDHHDYTAHHRAAAATATSSTAARTHGKTPATPTAPSSVTRQTSSSSSSSVPSRPLSTKGSAAAGASATAQPVSASNAAPSSEYAQQILEELMDQSPGVRWDDIAGLSLAKQTLQEAVILPNLRPDLFTGLRAPPKGVLLFGPPGTGKTLLAKAVATESGFAFFSISAASVTSKYLGEGEKLMRALFEVARAKQPSVIFFDEIDALMSARKDNEHEASRRLKTEFMTQLDGATSNASDRILIMGATNLPWDLDEAVLRRMVKRIYVPLPDTDARRALIVHLLNKQGASGQHLTAAQLNAIVHMTDGYSGSDLAAVCQEAALGPIRELPLDQLKTVKAEEVRPIQQQDFGSALRVIRPSVSPESLEQFRKWSDQFGVTSR